jgi:regulatory protein
MTVVSVKPGADPEILRIELSGRSPFSFKISYLSPPYQSDLLYVPGRELSPDEEEALFFAASCCRTERIALGLISRAEQTVFNLTRKLERRGHSAASVKAVLSRLEELEILSDRRYAELWLRSRLARRAESPRALASALRRRGIGKEDLQGALKSALNFETEWALLRRYLEKIRPPEGEKGLSLKYRLKSEGFSVPVLERYWEEQEN